MHDIDPHYSHDIADLFFDGWICGLTLSPNVPSSPLQFTGGYKDFDLATNDIKRNHGKIVDKRRKRKGNHYAD